jgi:hypothetical protein
MQPTYGPLLSARHLPTCSWQVRPDGSLLSGPAKLAVVAAAQRGACCKAPAPRPGSAASGIPLWAWRIDSKSSGASKSATGPPRIYLMVREAVLLNSLKRLMVAVPQHEHTILRWSGGPLHEHPGQHSQSAAPAPGYDDVAPHVGAQYAQVGCCRCRHCRGRHSG